MNHTYRLLALVSLAFIGQAQAIVHTNKTYYTSEPLHLSNSAASFAHNRHKESTEMGATVTVAPFYRSTVSGVGIGNYFGINGNNNINIGIGKSLDSRSIIHISGGSSPTLAGQISLTPQMQQYGASINYHQKLDVVCEKLWLNVELPIVHADYNLRTRVAGETTQAVGGSSFGVLDYFQGRLNQGTGVDQQNALAYAKLPSTARSKTGIADVTLKVGYDLVNHEHYGVRAYGTFVVPTGTKPRTSEYVFDAEIGYNLHWGLGAGLDLAAQLYHSDSLTIDLSAALSGVYRFANTQRRTLGLNVGNQNLGVTWAQYWLVGQSGTSNLMPLANVSTLPVSVLAGMSSDAALNLTFKTGDWTIDLGYRNWSRVAEKVTLNSSNWSENTYGLANAILYDGTHSFGSVSTDFSSLASATYISKDMLSTANASAPATSTHTIYSNAAYGFELANFPCMAGLGLSYEIAPENAVFSAYQITGKLGMSF